MHGNKSYSNLKLTIIYIYAEYIYLKNLLSINIRFYCLFGFLISVYKIDCNLLNCKVIFSYCNSFFDYVMHDYIKKFKIKNGKIL